jgi:hypothetical protein
VPPSYSLDLIPSDYYLFGSLKKKSPWGYYYTYDKAPQNTSTKVENTLKNNHASSKVLWNFHMSNW